MPFRHQRRHLPNRRLLLALSIVVTACGQFDVQLDVHRAAFAQTQPDDDTVTSNEPAAPSVTVELIEERRLAAEASVDLDEALRGRIGETYRRALDQVRSGTSFDDRRLLFEKRSQDADQKVASQKTSLAGVVETTEEAKRRLAEHQTQLADPNFVPEGELGELEKDRAAAEQNLKALRTSLGLLETEGVSRANRRRDVRARLLAAAVELSNLDKDLAAPPAAGDPPLLTLAKRTELIARRQALTKEIPALNAELLAYDAEDVVDKSRVDRDVVTQNIALAVVELQIRELLAKRKSDKVANDAVFAANAAVNSVVWPGNKLLAERNLELAQWSRDLNEKIAEVVNERKRLEGRLETVRRDFEITKKKVENVGLPPSVGAQLRNQRSALPNLQVHRTAIRTRQPRCVGRSAE